MIKIPHSIFFSKKLNHRAKLLYGYLLFNQETKIRDAELAEIFDVSTRAVQKDLKALKDNGYLTTNFLGGGRKLTPIKE